jgi:hypothetical protein
MPQDGATLKYDIMTEGIDRGVKNINNLMPAKPSLLG